MRLLLFCFLAVAISAGAQPSPYRVLRPIMKDPNQRQAPSSVTPQDLGSNPSPPQTPQAVIVPAAKPVEIVAKIDSALAASTITLMGRITGIKGTMFVTNLTSETVLPFAQFAVCDRNGFQIGVVTRLGSSLAGSGNEKLEVVATNAGSVDLKLMKLIRK